MSSEKKDGLQEYTDNAIKYGFLYGSSGLGLGLVASAVLGKYSRNWKSLTIGPKTFIISACGLAGFVLGSENATYKSSKSTHYQEHHNQQIKSYGQLFEENKFKLVGSMWVLSMAGATMYSWSQKHMKFSEKIVQVRMFAQAVTILGILGTAAISTKSFGDAPKSDLLEQSPWEAKATH